MKKFTALFFLCVITFFMFMAPVSLAVKQIEKHRQPEEIQESKIDWEKLYPFDGPETISEDVPKKETLYSYIKRKCEDYTSKYLLGYLDIVEGTRQYEALAGWNIAGIFDYNGIIKLKDGYLTSFTPQKDVTECAQDLIRFSEYCKSLGISFFYGNFPAKICIYEDEDISGRLDFVNQNADEFLSMLQKAGVTYYDFRKMLHEDGMNHHESFYITDGHWKAETGLWAARHILSLLHDDYGWNVSPDILSSENFDYVIYPEWFLGASGKKITLSKTKPEDFTMIYPKFTTLLHYEIPSKGINTSGDFSITYEMKHILKRGYYDYNVYAVYNHADCPLIILRNKLVTNGKKLLVIHDSFSNCVIPFLALDIQEIDAIDVRHFTGGVKSYINANKPDAIAVLYVSAHAGIPGMYKFR